MPVRMGHYLFSLLTKQLKQQAKADKELLAPVYALVFYHGSQSPYPYSLNLADCFKDPLAIMERWFSEPLPLVDVQQLPDEALREQQWVGIVARALKHIRSTDISPHLLEWLEDCEGLDDHSQQWLDFIRSLLHYALRAGNVVDIDELIEETHRLPKPIGETFMTIAEQLEARGEARGKAEALKITALNLLKEGAEAQFVARVTALPLEQVQQLQAQIAAR